jgi:hypothetical protein
MGKPLQTQPMMMTMSPTTPTTSNPDNPNNDDNGANFPANASNPKPKWALKTNQ